jgi:SAM-dependent methyltransferase
LNRDESDSTPRPATTDTAAHHTAPLYDAIARIYDPWSASVTEDVEFYVEQALAAGGPVVELAVGTGRIAVPIARAGVPVIGVDQSPGMLEVARAYAEREGVTGAIDLRVGDLRTPPVEGRFPLVVCPFRSLLHLADVEEKLASLHAAAGLLEPGGRYVFDVFAPSPEDIAETDGRWTEREPGINERADWDEASRTLLLSVRSGDASVSFTLHWLDVEEWEALIADAALEVEALYGWFDRRPFTGGEDMVWVCRAASIGRDGMQ